MLPLLMMIQAAAQNPEQWGPLLDSLGPAFSPSTMVPRLAQIAGGGGGLFGESTVPPTQVGAPPSTTVKPPQAAPVPAPMPAPAPASPPVPAPAPTPGVSPPTNATTGYDSLARQALGIAADGRVAPGLSPPTYDGFLNSPLGMLSELDIAHAPVPGNLTPSPLAMGAPTAGLAAALSAGRPDMPTPAPDPSALAAALLMPPQAGAPPVGGPPPAPAPMPVGGPPPTPSPQVAPQVRMPTAPAPVFSGGVTGSQKAPELGVQVSTGGTPAQLLLQALLARSQQDPLRVPLLNNLFGR